MVIYYGDGGAAKQEGVSEVLPPTKIRGAGKVLVILKGRGGGRGRGTTSFGVVSTQVLEGLTILEGGTKGFHLLQGRA